jgi:hypothetical protein
VRARLTEVGDGGEDQPRVSLEDGFGIEASRRQRARSSRLDPDIGTPQQAVEKLAAPLAVEVERHTALARVAEGEVQTVASPRREGRQPPCHCRRGGLDANHFGPEICEQAPAEFTPVVRAVDDADSHEGSLSIPHPAGLPGVGRRMNPAAHSPGRCG